MITTTAFVLTLLTAPAADAQTYPSLRVESSPTALATVTIDGKVVEFVKSDRAAADTYEVIGTSVVAAEATILVKARLLGRNRLVVFKRSGWSGGMSLVGLDYRPVDGNLTAEDRANVVQYVQSEALSKYLLATTGDGAPAVASLVIRMNRSTNEMGRIQRDVRRLDEQKLYSPAIQAKVSGLQETLDACVNGSHAAKAESSFIRKMWRFGTFGLSEIFDNSREKDLTKDLDCVYESKLAIDGELDQLQRQLNKDGVLPAK